MHIALFGGTGYVGSYLIDALVDAGHTPIVMVRPGSENKIRKMDDCKLIQGDIQDGSAISAALEHADAVIYNIGILREFPEKGITFDELQYQAPKRIIEAAEDAGIRRFLLMSANGAAAQGTSYQTTKFRAEQCLQNTTMDWTIFRPSVIFGDPRGRNEFATQLANDIIASPLPAPLFFDGLSVGKAGEFKLSPVHVLNVADAFIRSLASEETCNKVLHLGGPDSLSWREILGILSHVMSKRKLYLPAPVMVINIAATLFDRFAFFPVTRDQLKMLLAGNTCDQRTLDLLDITPLPFDAERLSYLQKPA